MKYKVGDKVRIKSLEWYNNSQKSEYGSVKHDDAGNSFVPLMRPYCGMEANITEVEGRHYILDIDNGNWFWQDFMFEEPIQESECTKQQLVDDSNYEQLKEITIELIRANANPMAVAFLAKEIYKELKKK